jgi:hypothetical protein
MEREAGKPGAARRPRPAATRAQSGTGTEFTGERRGRPPAPTSARRGRPLSARVPAALPARPVGCPALPAMLDIGIAGFMLPAVGFWQP